jgi:hypothetical protein
MSTIPGLPWSPSEAAGINEFLNTPLGRKWLWILQNRRPKIDTSSSERSALTGALNAGYDVCLWEIAGTRVVPSSAESASAKSIDPTRD